MLNRLNKTKTRLESQPTIPKEIDWKWSSPITTFKKGKKVKHPNMMSSWSDTGRNGSNAI
ncbi:hypothetical protein AVEN_146840-1, partial [Araneus ventricosus]